MSTFTRPPTTAALFCCRSRPYEYCAASRSGLRRAGGIHGFQARSGKRIVQLIQWNLPVMPTAGPFRGRVFRLEGSIIGGLAVLEPRRTRRASEAQTAYPSDTTVQRQADAVAKHHLGRGLGATADGSAPWQEIRFVSATPVSPAAENTRFCDAANPAPSAA